MLNKTLKWRKEMKIDSVLDEDFGSDLAFAAYMSGVTTYMVCLMEKML